MKNLSVVCKLQKIVIYLNSQRFVYYLFKPLDMLREIC